MTREPFLRFEQKRKRKKREREKLSVYPFVQGNWNLQIMATGTRGEIARYSSLCGWYRYKYRTFYEQTE